MERELTLAQENFDLAQKSYQAGAATLAKRSRGGIGTRTGSIQSTERPRGAQDGRDQRTRSNRDLLSSGADGTFRIGSKDGPASILPGWPGLC